MAVWCKDMNQPVKYCIHKEDGFYVAQCLNVDVSSFGKSVEEAVSNIKEALELYFEDADPAEYRKVEEVQIGESSVRA
jgi:predicted RNase H-like HicB family nuclease